VGPRKIQKISVFVSTSGPRSEFWNSRERSKSENHSSATSCTFIVEPSLIWYYRKCQGWGCWSYLNVRAGNAVSTETYYGSQIHLPKSPKFAMSLGIYGGKAYRCFSLFVPFSFTFPSKYSAHYPFNLKILWKLALLLRIRKGSGFHLSPDTSYFHTELLGFRTLSIVRILIIARKRERVIEVSYF
jgi:hypothetical protein